ncbi:MAG: hypothetical protein ACYDGN_12385 [Acidimicrobiales bacterium]
MAESASSLSRSPGPIVYERPLDQAIPASAWRAILADDERVTLETSPVQLVRAIRDSTGD